MEYDDRRLRILYEELVDGKGADLYEDEGMRLLVALAGQAAVIGLAVPAQADDGDFLAGLNNAGITYQSGPDAIGIGGRACDLMDQATRRPTSSKP